uniref:Regulator of telomere elongation helicase 1 n=1 Tax=Latimeria chalumnae TaxID=7897 RepID=H3A3B4_LATCH
MPKLKLNGLTVDFPFEPYKCQEEYMLKVIECLQKKVNGVLESPTGTGKTLCLLCATLAWREHFKDGISARKIAERMQGVELFPDRPMSSWGTKATDGDTSRCWVPSGIPSFLNEPFLAEGVGQFLFCWDRPKVCVLGSRDQLCINPEVKMQESSHVKIHMCRAKVSSRSCPFYNSVEEKSTDKDFSLAIMDIEDLVKNGIKHSTERCDFYFVSRFLTQMTDEYFLMENVQVDWQSSRAHNIDLRGAVVIFDEAHNVERICEESVSFDLTPFDLASGIDTLNQALEEKMKVVQQNELHAEFNMESIHSGLNMELKDLIELKKTFLDLENAIDSIKLPANGNGVTKPGRFLWWLFSNAMKFCVKFEALRCLKIDECFWFLGSGIFTSTMGLQKLIDVIQIVFSKEPEAGVPPHAAIGDISKYYKVHIHPDNSSQKRKQRTDIWAAPAMRKQGKILSYWCFSPGYGMHELVKQGVRSIILTSGTLSPLSSFTLEMQIPFPVCLENPHVIEKHQIWVGIVPKGPDGEQLSSAFDRRKTGSRCCVSLPFLFSNIARVVPHGLLLFFPSYPVMDKSLAHWRDCSIAGRIEELKPMFVEPRGKASFTEVMDAYYDKVCDARTNGASFLAVCRGKASEGLDFADRNGRGVIVTGLPFPPQMDPRVTLKMHFLDEMRGKTKTTRTWYLSGKEWYRQQASRAVNQAIGRVIRHKQDYGAIFLCDHRFMNADIKSQLPAWIQPHVKVYDNFGHIIRDVSQFFRVAQKIQKPAPVGKKKFPPLGRGESVLQKQPKNQTELRGKTTAALNSLSLVCADEGQMPGGDGVARLCVEYERELNPSGRKTVGLLDALEHTERRTEEEEEEEEFPGEEKAKRLSTLSLQHDKRLLDEQRGGRKKIKIVGNRTDTAAPPQLWKTESAKHFLVMVNQSLSQSNYSRFNQAMKAYKETDDFDPMLAVMSAIFTEDPKKHRLLRDFYYFIRPQHKKRYDEACRALTGEGCGYKPEDSLSRAAKKIPEKNPKGETAKSKFTSSQPSSKQLNSETHLNKGGAFLNSGALDEGERAFVTQQLSRGGGGLSRCTASGVGGLLSAYLAEVKGALGLDGYKQFMMALQTYKQSDNYENMVAETASFFTERQEDFHLLQRFCMFVRPHHKQKFSQICKELTGLDCGRLQHGSDEKRAMNPEKEQQYQGPNKGEEHRKAVPGNSHQGAGLNKEEEHRKADPDSIPKGAGLDKGEGHQKADPGRSIPQGAEPNERPLQYQKAEHGQGPKCLGVKSQQGQHLSNGQAPPEVGTEWERQGQRVDFHNGQQDWGAEPETQDHTSMAKETAQFGGVDERIGADPEKPGTSHRKISRPGAEQQDMQEGRTVGARTPTVPRKIPSFPVKPVFWVDYPCPKCRSGNADFFKCPLCDFTSCGTCWEQRLKASKECPKCHNFTKKRHLTKIYL